MTTTADAETFVLVEGDGPIIATAIHDGHALRSDCAARIVLAEPVRLREEDPYTGRVAEAVPTRLVARRSRFEVDLNRTRDKAVYLCPADAWDLEVWCEWPPPDDCVARSRAQYDAFYAALDRVLRDRIARYGAVAVLDIHSYNHRRGGPDAPPADPAGNPEINIGTSNMDPARWGRLVDRFCADLAAAAPFGAPLDVRPNVKFQGGAMVRWIHDTFPGTACAIAIELKKTFMDEWTGVVDEKRLAGLRAAIAATLPGLLESLRS